jgi:hypothetical protein
MRATRKNNARRTRILSQRSVLHRSRVQDRTVQQLASAEMHDINIIFVYLS